MFYPATFKAWYWAPPHLARTIDSLSAIPSIIMRVVAEVQPPIDG
jgi:hypothetical protein